MTKIKQITSDNEEKKVNLSLSKEEAIASIIDGLYKGRPLLEEGGIFRKLIKEITEAAIFKQGM